MNVRTDLAPNAAWMLWTQARERPGSPAIVDKGTAHTYGSLHNHATRVSAMLQESGLERGDRVAIFLDRGVAPAAAFFGVIAAGGVAIMVNETLRPRQVEHILRHATARFLLSGPEVLDRQPRTIQTEAHLLTLETLRDAPVGIHPVDRIGSDPAQIIYTSGSTGLPKGVTVTHANLWAGMRAVTSYLGINEDDRIASLLPFSFDYGFNQLLCAVGTGASLVVERSALPQQVATVLRRDRVTVLAAVPPLWHQLLSAPAFRTPIESLRILTNTGGRLPINAIRDLRTLQPQADLFLMYGLTEAFRATYLPPEEVDRRPDSIGRAIPGAEIMVLREDLTPCAPGEVGELTQRGPTVTAGYWADPEATARVFRINPLRPAGMPDTERIVFSGDLVRMDEEGFLYFVGRRDHLIKTLGYRVSPDEVADALQASGHVAEAIVTSEPDPVRGERIVAYVVLATNGSLEELERYCRTELPRYLQPARLEVRTALPRTASGKYDIRAVSGSTAAAGPTEHPQSGGTRQH